MNLLISTSVAGLYSLPTLLRAVLTGYLLLAVLMPSYQGFKKGLKFHFFELVESEAQFVLQYPGEHEIGTYFDSDHPYSVLYFFPSRCAQRDYHKLGPDAAGAYSTVICSPIFAEYADTNSYSKRLHAAFIFDHKTSGLAPPPALLSVANNLLFAHISMYS